MKPVRIHSWNVSPSEAFAIQMNLRDKITIQPLPDEIHLVAGTNVSHDPNTNTIHAALVILRFPGMELVERHGLSEEINKYVDCHITINKLGNMDSLNVAMAGSIILSKLMN